MASNAGRVTLQDVALAAKVSASAVSRAFTPGASISGKTRTAVLEVAQSLGYRPNRLARGLTTRQTGMVAVVMANLGSPFFSAFLGALNARLKSIQHQMMLILIDRSGVDEALDEALEYGVDGIIFVSTTPTALAAERAQRAGARLVVMDAYDPGPPASWVWVDSPDIGRRVAELFLQEGRRRPALISPYIDRPDPPEREAFEARLAAAGVSPVRLVKAQTTYDGGVQACAEIFGDGAPLDCVFALSDALALGFCDAARLDHGCDLPHALSVVGIGDVPATGWRSHAISTISLPIHQLSDAAVSILAAELADPSTPRSRITLACELIERGTTLGGSVARGEAAHG